MFEQAVQTSDAMRQAVQQRKGVLIPALSGCPACQTPHDRRPGARFLRRLWNRTDGAQQPGDSASRLRGADAPAEAQQTSQQNPPILSIAT
jgi:hypothetical protein